MKEHLHHHQPLKQVIIVGHDCLDKGFLQPLVKLHPSTQNNSSQTFPPKKELIHQGSAWSTTNDETTLIILSTEPTKAGTIGPQTRIIHVTSAIQSDDLDRKLTQILCKEDFADLSDRDLPPFDALYESVVSSMMTHHPAPKSPSDPSSLNFYPIIAPQLMPFDQHPLLNLYPPWSRSRAWFDRLPPCQLKYESLIVNVSFLLTHGWLDGSFVWVEYHPYNEKNAPRKSRILQLVCWEGNATCEQEGFVHPSVLSDLGQNSLSFKFSVKPFPQAEHLSGCKKLEYLIIRTMTTLVLSQSGSFVDRIPLSTIHAIIEERIRQHLIFVIPGIVLDIDLDNGDVYHIRIEGNRECGTWSKITPTTEITCRGFISTDPPPLFKSQKGLYDNPFQFDHGSISLVRELVRPLLKLKNHVEIFCCHGPRRSGKTLALRMLSQEFGIHHTRIDCWEYMTIENLEDRESALLTDIETILTLGSQILVLQHIEAISSNSARFKGLLTRIRALIRKSKSSSEQFIHVACLTSSPPAPSIGPLFKYHFAFDMVSVENSEALFKMFPIHPLVKMRDFVESTASFVFGDIMTLLQEAFYAAEFRIRGQYILDSNSSPAPVILGVQITWDDVEPALKAIKDRVSTEMGSPSIPNVKWEDIGGLMHVKETIMKHIELPLKFPRLFGAKNKSGILLYGPPGTGKTLVAKAVATTFDIHFFSVKGPELLNMYIGESEANIRAIFQKARNCSPCVLFFDELDSIAPNRGLQGDSGGVMDRMVTQLLAELDDCPGVFVIGATNRPDLIDPALLRPGRFDNLLYLGVCESIEARLGILSALVRKFTLDPTLDLEFVASQCPPNYTGADFYALCSAALLSSLVRRVQQIEDRIPRDANGQPVNSFNSFVQNHPDFAGDIGQVCLDDFYYALEQVKPSVSEDELLRYRMIKERFEE